MSEKKYSAVTALQALEAESSEVLAYAQEADGLKPTSSGARNFMNQFAETYPEFSEHLLLTGLVAGLFRNPPYPGPKREEAKKNIVSVLTHFRTLLENAPFGEPDPLRIEEPENEAPQEEMTQFLGNASRDNTETDEVVAPISSLPNLNREVAAIEQSLETIKKVISFPNTGSEVSGVVAQESFSSGTPGEERQDLSVAPVKKETHSREVKGRPAPTGFKRLTINLSEETHQKLMDYVKQRGTTATWVIEGFLKTLPF